ncbi:prokaryotic n-terminal methylation site [Desulfoluna butyratoxydans]|uniref:Prokaryotic n-terminal methylation site n=2 Tax=Desulfoluna butyratoxydans TaxID=231438 RepID=A0A4U8YPW0_9BACT|nr:prokaryotic n-terminal methylation site [Desulfoluna butyratoxydans]
MVMYSKQQGFTLLEIMVAVALSFILISAAYFFYNHQVQTRVTQERVTDMQQNLRAAMLLMEDDIRMAGYDPNGTTGAAITVATASRLTFSYSMDGDANGTDDDGDGDVDEADEALLTETISYGLFDDGSDGVSDLGRTVGTGSPVAVSENVEAMELSYLLEDGSVTGTPSDLTQIVAVRFAILARTRTGEQGFSNSATYAYDPLDSTKVWGPYNDEHRRRLLRHTVRCRNRGI